MSILECGGLTPLLKKREQALALQKGYKMTDWAHSPIHRLNEAGAYIVTAGTYQKASIFNEPKKLNLVRDTLLSLTQSYGWNLQAWAIMANHYHFVAISSEDFQPLQRLIRHLHSFTAREINAMDNMPGRKVWFQYWDTYLTYEKSYLARLKYVHNNPVHHKLVPNATDYEWCSAKWFETKADRAFFKIVNSFKIDRVNVKDDF